MITRRVFKDSIALTTSGTVAKLLKFVDIPIGVGDMLSRLRAIRFDLRLSDLDHAGGALTPHEIHNALSGITLEADGKFFGPKNLTGADLAAVRSFFTGERLPWLCQDATYANSGDLYQAAGSNTVRRLVAEYRFDKLSALALDFAPMIAALHKANATLSFNIDAPANVTSLTATLEIYVELEPSFDIVAVAPVLTERVSCDKLEGGVLPGGLALGTLIRNEDDWAAGDITYLRAEVDGKSILVDVEPNTLHLASKASNTPDLIAAVNKYATFMYPYGMNPTNHANRYTPFLCANHANDPRFSKKPVGRSFAYTIAGSEVASKLAFVHTRATPLTTAEVARQWSASGKLSGEAIEAAIKSGAVKLKTTAKTVIRGEYAAFAPAKYAA